MRPFFSDFVDPNTFKPTPGLCVNPKFSGLSGGGPMVIIKGTRLGLGLFFPKMAFDADFDHQITVKWSEERPYRDFENAVEVEAELIEESSVDPWTIIDVTVAYIRPGPTIHYTRHIDMTFGFYSVADATKYRMLTTL
jgi:hypothetical protein